MVFSAFNISRTMVQFTGNSPGSKIPNRPVAGGSFTPNTMESFVMLRSQLDNQFESAFVTKYKSLMQNRLNSMADKLRSSYGNLLNISMGQQIGANAGASVRSDTIIDGTTGTAAQTISNAVAGDDAFVDIGVSHKSVGAEALTGVNFAATQDGLNSDGITGYSRDIGGTRNAEFRMMSPVARAAADMAGKMKITMRTEEDPPDDINNPFNFFTDALAFAFGGPPEPTQFNMKVSDYETDFNVGGFWSAVNYLYNFAPRQLRYTYGIGYSANSDEAGNKAYLVEGALVDGRDIQGGPGTDTSYAAFGGNPASQPKGNRLKWAGMDPTQGYTTEVSGSQANFGTVTNRQKVLIERTDQFGNQLWYSAILPANGDADIVDDVTVMSGSKFYGGPDDTSGMYDTATPTNVEENSKIIIESSISYTVTSTLFMNHYEMETRTVDFNTPNSGVPIGLAQDTGLGAPLNQQVIQFQSNALMTTFGVGDRIKIGNQPATYVKRIGPLAANNPTAGDPALTNLQLEVEPALLTSPTTAAGSEDIIYKVAEGTVLAASGMSRSFSVDGSKNYQIVDGTRSISAGSAKISKNFTGKFAQSIHKIHSVNGQDVVSNAGPHDANTGAPLIGNFEIAKYEGFMRSLAMSRGLVAYEHPTPFEVNAADVVPTNWVNAEMLSPDSTPGNVESSKVWFPYINDTIYNLSTAIPTDQGYRGQTIQARNSFELTEEELFQIQPIGAWTTGPDGILRPTFTPKDFFIDIDLGPDAANAKLFVNGVDMGALTANPPGVNTVNLGGATSPLKAGDNSIVIQLDDPGPPSTSNNEGLSVRVGAGNIGVVDDIIVDRIQTGYGNGTGTPPPLPRFEGVLQRPNMAKILSRWQTRLVPPRTSADAANTLLQMASDPLETGSSFKGSNSFAEILMQHINDPLYQDVYRMGLFSKLNKLLVQGNGQTPSGASLTGSVSTFFDFDSFFVKVDQDKLVSKAG